MLTGVQEGPKSPEYKDDDDDEGGRFGPSGAAGGLIEVTRAVALINSAPSLSGLSLR